MKSLKIAALGVAALGFAAAPAFGAFATVATTTHTDAIEITVSPSCTLGTIAANTGAFVEDDASTHTPLSGTWTNGSMGTAGVGRTDTLATTMLPGTKNDNIGTTTLTVRCNNVLGYDVKALASDGGKLTDKDHLTTTTAIQTKATPTDGSSFWNFKLSVPASTGTGAGMVLDDDYKTADTAFAIPTLTSTRIAGKTASGNIGDGEYLTIQYGAGISTSQESGTYTGSVVYTLAQLEASGS